MANRFRPVPSNSYVTSPFGPRWGTVHRGTDFGREGGSGGMAVYAAQGGTVVYAGAASGFGGDSSGRAGWVVVDHPTADGAGTTVYGHIVREPGINVGTRVEAGQKIATVNPNQATNGGVAPHLHFEYHPTVWAAGSQRDPIAWLGNAKSPDQPGSKAPANPSKPPAGVLFGVDVSEWQNGMALTQAAREGMAYAIIRTTDGTYKDPVYRSHYEDARNAGLVIAAYHYLRNPSEGTTVAQQVKASLEVMGNNHRAPVWLDCETPAGLHIDHIRQAKRAYEAAGVRVIGVYSYVPYWEGRIKPGEPDTHELGALWVAAYGTDRAGLPSVIYPGNDHRQWNYPLGNQRPALWQFGSKAHVAGFSVDINAFKGSKDQLRALFYGEPVKNPKPSRPPEPVTPAPEHTQPVAPNPETGPGSQAPSKDPAPAPRRTVMDLLLDLLVSMIVGKR